MAHTGREYKLWFRRDAAWDINNYTYAYPEAYYVYFSGQIASRDYDLSSIRSENAVNLHKLYDRTWVSRITGTVEDNTFWVLQFTNAPDEKLDRLRIAVWHAALIDTPLFDATYRLNESEPVYYNMQGGAMLQLHFLSEKIFVDPVRFQPWIKAARWDRYQP